MDESQASWAMTGQTHLSLQLGGFPVKRVTALSPIWGGLQLEPVAPNQARLCICSPGVKVHQERKGEDEKRKEKVQNGSKDGFEVQPRSRDQEVRAVIAAGYQLPFLFQDRPQQAGVSPQKAGRDNTHLCRRTEAALKWKSHRDKTALCISNAEANRKYLEHV